MRVVSWAGAEIVTVDAGSGGSVMVRIEVTAASAGAEIVTVEASGAGSVMVIVEATPASAGADIVTVEAGSGGSVIVIVVSDPTSAGLEMVAANVSISLRRGIHFVLCRRRNELGRNHQQQSGREIVQ